MEVMQNATELSRQDSTQQLDFYESMIHFKTMFPTMEEEIIEAVLRANNGAVDTTVDQLLNMSSDCTGSSESDLRMVSSSDSDSSDDVCILPVRPDDAFTINIIPPSPSTNSGGARPKQRTNQIHDMFEPFETEYSNVAFSRPTTASTSSPVAPKPRRVTAKRVCPSHDYANEFDYLPEINEEAPPIPEKPGYLRKLTGNNLMDASITDLRLMGSPNAAAKSKIIQQRSPQQQNTDYSNTLNVDKEEDDIFVTPTNLHQPVVNAPDAPVAHDPRKVDACAAAAKRPRAMSMPTFQHTHLSPVSLYKKYRPALLGDLPDDFLRLELSPNPEVKPKEESSQQQSSMSKIDAAMMHPRYHKRSASEQGHSLRYTPSHERHHHHVMGGWRRRHEKPREATDLARQWLSLKLQENERQRDACRLLGGEGGATQQVLGDEYLALVLQNEEFLLELRQDSEFMSALRTDRGREQANVEVELEPLPDTPETESASAQPPAEEYIEEVPQDDVEATEGSGDAKMAESSALAPRDDNTELRKQLLHMGTASKKKLLAIARRFFALTKRSPSKPLFSQANTPSTMNLLLEEETPCMDTLDRSREEEEF